jgi:hypothetical protein
MENPIPMVGLCGLPPIGQGQRRPMDGAPAVSSPVGRQSRWVTEKKQDGGWKNPIPMVGLCGLPPIGQGQRRPAPTQRVPRRPDGAPAVSSPVGWQSRWVTQKRFKIGSSQGIERGFCTGLDGEIGGMTAAMARRMVFSRARRAWGRGNPGRLTRRMVREDGITTYSRRTTGSVPGAFSIFASFKARLTQLCFIFC